MWPPYRQGSQQRCRLPVTDLHTNAGVIHTLSKESRLWFVLPLCLHLAADAEFGFVPMLCRRPGSPHRSAPLSVSSLRVKLSAACSPRVQAAERPWQAGQQLCAPYRGGLSL